MKKTVEKILKENLNTDTPIFDILKLHGDASYRTYYRAKLTNGSSFIVMQMPEGKVSASEEITNFNGTQNELPFINIARFLNECNIPVPTVYFYDEAHRIMILEDLGDDLMARKVEKSDDATRLEWYKKAIDLLVTLQKNTNLANDSNCVALKRSFDATLLNWEFDHFLEYGIEARTGKKPSPDDLKIFNEETRLISKKIEALPRGFTHRDFQSRNLIVKDGRLCLIDFQDALLGPSVYDLVALTRDSYVKLSNPLLNELCAYYSDLTKKPIVNLRTEFDLITVQRKLKDAGRFVYIDRVKGNPNFLQYIPTSLGYIREALLRLPEHKRLYEVIKKYTPEWN